MSTAAATAAGAAAPNPGADGAAPDAKPKKVETVPADIRRRVLGMKSPPPETAEAKAAREKAEKDAADKKAADDKTAADKKAADEAAARGGAAPGAGATVDKVKKVRGGPPLPEQKPAATTNSEEVRKLVRDVMAEGKETLPAGPAIDPEVQREIDLAAFAEKKNPERYNGMATKVKTFFTTHDQLLAEKSKELGGAKSDEFKDYLESDEYKNWVAQNRPSYTRGDKAKLAEDLIAERARAEARQELAPELKKLERATAELQHAPVIKAKTNQALTVIITDPSEQKDPALEGFAKDPIKFGNEHPEEAQLIAAEAADAVELIEEVYKIDLDLVDFNPKAPTPKQAEIRQFVRGQNASLRQQYPQGIEMKDGTILIDADTFAERGLDKDQRYRVFSADEIAGMIAATRNAKVLDRLKKRRDGITKSVYAPKSETPAAPPAGQKTKDDDEPPSPAAGARAAPGSGGKPNEQKSLARRYA